MSFAKSLLTIFLVILDATGINLRKTDPRELNIPLPPIYYKYRAIQRVCNFVVKTATIKLQTL